MVHRQVGYDAGKQIKGRKRFLAVDTLGLVLVAFVTAAQEPERAGGKQLLQRVKALGQQVWRLHTIWVDSGAECTPAFLLELNSSRVVGFDGSPFMRWVMDRYRWIVEVIRRHEQHKGFVVLPKRWVVERTFGWLMGCRRLARDYELLPETSETFIYLAMIPIMVRRLA